MYVSLKKSVLIAGEVSEALQAYVTLPFTGNKEAAALQTAYPLNYSMQPNSYRAPMSCIKLQNWLTPLT